MKNFQRLCLLSMVLATCACQSHPGGNRTIGISAREAVTVPDSPRRSANTTNRSSVQAPATRSAVHVPKNFSEYGAQALDGGGHCVVGAITDDDGMNERAVAYVIEANATQPTWVDMLDLPSDTYQSRATHCTSNGSALFVLLQSDTQPQQTLSQTLLRVARLDPANGAVQVQHDVPVPGTFSAWVELGPGHFHWKEDMLVVSGNRRPESSPDQQATFTMHMDSHLNSVQEQQP